MHRRADALRRHLYESCKCERAEKAKRYGFFQHQVSICIIKYSYFNVYWLGAMDAFLDEVGIDDGLYEFLAGRKRGSTISPPFMTESSAEGNKILQELGWIH